MPELGRETRCDERENADCERGVGYCCAVGGEVFLEGKTEEGGDEIRHALVASSVAITTLRGEHTVTSVPTTGIYAFPSNGSVD